MKAAVAHFGNWVVLLAATTAHQVEMRPDFPIDLLPRNSVGLAHEGDELFQVPVAVNDVLGSHLSVDVNERGALCTGQNFALLFGEQFITIGAFV